jgi:hypothetical protein
MDKKEAKKLGAWVSLLGGLCFLLSIAASAYVAFFIKPDTATRFLLWLGRAVHNS